MKTERLLVLIASLGLLVALGACNTVEGVGMDISSGARTVGGWFGGR
ncbi:entericidin EcnA/B family protein [Alkalilacustris brevis]|nr:entericidin EcnA/B family protein [Alkalilacustris brevis]